MRRQRTTSSRILIAAAILLALGIFQNCSPGGDAPADPIVDGAGGEDKLHGAFTQACEAQGENSQKVRLHIGADGQLRLVLGFFVDATCAEGSLAVGLLADYQVEAATEMETFLRLNIRALELTPQTDFIASTFNHQKLCGLSEWIRNEPQIVTSTTCGVDAAGFPQTGVSVLLVLKPVAGGWILQNAAQIGAEIGVISESLPFIRQ